MLNAPAYWSRYGQYGVFSGSLANDIMSNPNFDPAGSEVSADTIESMILSGQKRNRDESHLRVRARSGRDPHVDRNDDPDAAFRGAGDGDPRAHRPHA